MIIVCAECGVRFRAPDTIRGKKVRCSRCGHVFRVPLEVGAAGAIGRPSTPPALPAFQETVPTLEAEQPAAALDQLSAAVSGPVSQGWSLPQRVSVMRSARFHAAQGVSKGTMGIIGAVLAAALSYGGYLLFFKAASAVSGVGSKITRETFNKISVGDSMADVKALLGSPDTESESHMEGLGEIVLWHFQRNTFDGAVAITVFFSNGRVSDKTWTKI